MALTVAVTEAFVEGNKWHTRGTIDFDSSYPTGGESLTANQLGLRVVETAHFENHSGYVLDYDYSNALLLAYYADYDAGADGAHIEVTDSADLSGVTSVRFSAVGV